VPLADQDFTGEFKLMRYLSRFALLTAATVLTPPVLAAVPGPSVPMPTMGSQVWITDTQFMLMNCLTLIVKE
jgi:hypothetical protein